VAAGRDEREEYGDNGAPTRHGIHPVTILTMVAMDPVRPDYDGACIVNLVRALQGRAEWVPQVAREAEAVVLLVLDGFGWTELEARRRSLPVLGSLSGGSITSVVPSTTPTALASISTGLTPAEHGIVAYRMFVGSGVLNVLRWSIHGGGVAPDPLDLQPRDAFDGQPIPVVTRSQFRESKFTEILYRGASFNGWMTTSGLIEQTGALIDAGERFVYAYYDGPDLVAHIYGMRNGFYARELAFCDRLVGELLEALPEGTTLVVTADHGHTHFEDRIELGSLTSLVAVQSGESRFRYLHARPGAADELAAAARELYSGNSWVFERDQLVDEGWLGPRAPSADVRRRIGDVILAAKEPIGFVDPDNPGEGRLLSGHGSLTPSDMLVPLIAARGTRR
jgi:hypothetical protein